MRPEQQNVIIAPGRKIYGRRAVNSISKPTEDDDMRNAVVIFRATLACLALLISLPGCEETEAPSTPLPTQLIAAPNPVPAGGELGKTTISWSIAGNPRGHVSVSVDGEDEKLFAEFDQPGSREAGWIEQGATYEFRLYEDSRPGTPLEILTVAREKSRVTVHGETTGTISAKPNPVPAGIGPGSTTISWVLSEGEKAQIFVSTGGQEEKLFAEVATSGAREVDWVGDDPLDFRLYAGKSKEELLDEVFVTRSKAATTASSEDSSSIGD